MRPVDETLEIADSLAARFALLRGEAERSVRRSVVELARVLAFDRVRYAVIDGVAVQIWSAEPRTTLDVAVAVLSCDSLPRDAMAAAGFVFGRRFEHSENWTGPDGALVQFTDDPLLADAVHHAEERSLAGHVLRITPVFDLVRAKLRAADDPSRRRSKRMQDLTDAVALTEQHPDALARLTPDERHRLQP